MKVIRLSRKKSFVDEDKMRHEINRLLKNDNISEDIRRLLIERLSSNYKYSNFINIVEEPEQNLYPISQKGILFSLLSNKNKNTLNRLIITTHSPYIINYLTLAVKAFMIRNKVKDFGLFDELDSVVPINSIVNPLSLNIYQLKESGEIERLENYNGLPSDENYLNEFLGAFNDDFVKLLEIENKCR